jgi:hypothetical protein
VVEIPVKIKGLSRIDQVLDSSISSQLFSLEFQ